MPTAPELALCVLLIVSTSAVAAAVSTTTASTTVATSLTATLAVAVANPLIVATLLAGSGSVAESLLDADHLASLVLVRAHLSVALHLHRSHLSSLPPRSLHDPGPNLVSNLHAVGALACSTQLQLHLLALSGSDGEVIEFAIVLGLLLLLELDYFSSHLLGTLLSREGEGGEKGCQDHQGHGLFCSFHWVVPPHSHSGSVAWFLFDAHQQGVKQSSCQILVVL